MSSILPGSTIHAVLVESALLGFFLMRAAFAAAAMTPLLLTSCGAEPVVLSSRTSPNGSTVAENVLTDHGGAADGGTSHLIIRNIQEGGGNEAELSEPAPDLFMRWIDERHLEVWRQEGACDSSMPGMMGDVHIACRSYVPSSFADAYRRPGLSTTTTAVPASNVLVNFHQRATEHGTSCILSIGTGPDPSYDSASVEIVVGISNSCKRDHDRPCAGIETRFGLGATRGTARQTMLTSATIADIPSHNRIPEGGEGTRIRGQFGGDSAAALIEQLKKPSIQIEYSRDFFDQVLKYDVPLTGHAQKLDEFNACIGDADLLWVRHAK